MDLQTPEPEFGCRTPDSQTPEPESGSRTPDSQTPEPRNLLSGFRTSTHPFCKSRHVRTPDPVFCILPWRL